MEKCKQQNIKGWITRTKGKTLKAALDANCNWQWSVWPLGNKSNKIYRNILTFKHKLLTGLSTRNSMQNRKNYMLTTLKKCKPKSYINHFITKFSSPLCVRCTDNTVENTEHVFNCSSNKLLWDEAKTKILNKIFTLSKKEVEFLPWWFGGIDEPYPIATEHSLNLNNFNKDWGNKGIMPKALLPFLVQDLGISTKVASTIYEETSKIITKTTFKIWINRNNSLENWTIEKLQSNSTNQNQ
jgi:hypothetical protein